MVESETFSESVDTYPDIPLLLDVVMKGHELSDCFISRGRVQVPVCKVSPMWRTR
jgi:hypothetical protein